MRWLVLNVILGAIDVALFAAIARGVRARNAIRAAVALALMVLFAETGFSPARFHAMRSASYV